MLHRHILAADCHEKTLHDLLALRVIEQQSCKILICRRIGPHLVDTLGNDGVGVVFLVIVFLMLCLTGGKGV